MNKITVIGSGSWGTALAQHLGNAGNEVILWGRNSKVLNEIKTSNTNSRFFPDLKLSSNIKPEENLEIALSKSEVIVLSIPSSSYLEFAQKTSKNPENKQKTYVITSKGLEKSSLRTLSKVLEDELGEEAKIAALSGPSFAKELTENKPTAAVIAAKDESLAKTLAKIFHTKTFRIYTSDDLTGVQLCGAMKNIIALAIGIVDGKGIGLNARAAIITRGLVEMARVVKALGGKEKTVYGLTGLGDLVLTATGDLSRNRQVGLRLGQGEELKEILESLGQVSEGVVAAEKFLALSREENIKTPIIEEVVSVLQGKTSVNQSIENLLNRPIVEES